MPRSYWMTLVACGCLCVAAIYQNARISELESRLGLKSDGDAPGLAVAHAADTAITSTEVLGRLGAVERRLGAMQRQLALGLAPDDSGQGAITPWPEEELAQADGEPEPLQKELEPLLHADDVESEEKRERLRNIIREEQQAVFQEHREERWKRRRERQDEALKDFAERSEISESQLEDMMVFVNQGRTQVRSLYDAAHAGEVDFGEARESAQALRTQTDEQIKEILDEEQYLAYAEYREQERARRGH